MQLNPLRDTNDCATVTVADLVKETSLHRGGLTDWLKDNSIRLVDSNNPYIILQFESKAAMIAFKLLVA